MTRTILQADARRLPLADGSVDLTFTSPPYADARTYGIGAQRKCVEWVEWMLGVLAELQRVCRGPVIVNAAGVTRDRNYWPTCEGLMWEWWKRGGECQLYRPCFWHRVGIPGSGGKDWFRADVEYVMCFKRSGKLPWSDNTANGHRPKWAPGGEMAHRRGDGTRVNQRGSTLTGMRSRSVDGKMKAMSRGSRVAVVAGEVSKDAIADYWADPDKAERETKLQTRRRPNGERAHTKSFSRADGTVEEQVYIPPTLANPGNLIRGIKVGGGLMGHPLAHENEAPFPVKLAEWFIRSLCPPGGTVLDPFAGSGTTGQAAEQLGRGYILSDIRQSQVELSKRRLAMPHMQRAPRPPRCRHTPTLFPDASVNTDESKRDTDVSVKESAA